VVPYSFAARKETTVMVQRATIDATDIPELRRIAEEVRDTGEPVVIRSGDEDLAVVTPIASARGLKDWRPTPEQIEATMSAAGSWKGLIDVDKFKAEMKAARGSKRPPVEL
jgi:hypothetical protein